MTSAVPPDHRDPYSPSVQQATCSGSAVSRLAFPRSMVTYAATAVVRMAVSAASVSPDPSASSRMRLCAADSGTRSPPRSKTLFSVSTYHWAEGAYRSASSTIRRTMSARACMSPLVLPTKAVMCSTMVSTLSALVIACSRCSVLCTSISSESWRQSITAIWCSAAYCGSTPITQLRPSTPQYFTERFGWRMKCPTIAMHSFSRAVLG
mmetsp:Transcript_12898/g.54176  ORF Transcript_12898/g.54176 Transcript_12898/m.54176 type:complete len:208 (-) Transcript_12898:1374-1997(-)